VSGITVNFGGSTIELDIAGGRGPLGPASGPLGSGSVTAATVSNSSSEQIAITNKLRTIQAGVGAVSRAIQDELRDTIKIKQYGAAFDVGDHANIADAADDTAAWVKALAHLVTIGGGTLVLPPGASKVTAQIDIPAGVPIRIIGSGCRGVYPGVYTAGTKVPSTVVPVHSGRSAFRFIGSAGGDGSFYASDWNIATLESGTYPDSGFGWETGGAFLYGFSFLRMGIYGFKNAGVGEAFVVYKTIGSENAVGQMLIQDCCIHRNNWIFKNLNSTQINGFKFLNNKAGQNGFTVGNGGILVSGHDVEILGNVMESNRDTIYVSGAYYDVTIRGNYFESNVGLACIRLNDTRGTYMVGPNNYGMALTFATAGQDPAATAVLGHKVVLGNTGTGLCIDPYFPAVTHKLTPPRLGRVAGNNLNTNLQNTYCRVDSLEGQAFSASPSFLTQTQQGVTGVVREINPASTMPMPAQEYTTTGTGAVTGTTSGVTGSAGQWLVASWLLRRMSAAGEGVDPYITLLPDSDPARKVDIPINNYRFYWTGGEWSLITVAARLTATMTTLQYNLFPHNISPTAGWVSRFLRPLLYTVDDVNKVLPFINNKLAESGTAAPTTGAWLVGDKVWNSAPAVDGSNMIITGWVCTTAGTPGTWLPMRISTVSPAT
jgi:hypothetical protein